MTRSRIVVLAALLDAAVGDVECAPHPVRMMGAAITRAEARLRAWLPQSMRGERVGGAALVATIVGASSVAGACIARVPVLDVATGGATLALRNLLDEARAVHRALHSGDLSRARTRVARIVGRDTATLGESEIARATIETLAESLCDGVVAPVMALAVGGVPAALAYKAINTLDSMVGHIEEPYRYFGTAAARLDDAANFFPARIAACAIAVAAAVVERRGAAAARCARLQGRLHRSPNAGQTEAAMAGALGVRLGGTNWYDGVAVESAVFAPECRAARASDILRAMRVIALAAALSYAFAFTCARWSERR